MSEKSSDVNYQSAQAEVHHKNIDQAGDDHPFGSESKDFTADMKTMIRRVADDLYDSWQATVREYLANAETACLRTKEYVDTGEVDITDNELIVTDSYQPKIEVFWDKSENSLTIKDNGIGMSADTVDQVFRQIGVTTGRDSGQYSGAYGQGALSYCKFTGLDNSMIMTSHSRINDDNASYYLTLAGVEPIVGQLPDDQYGTSFQMTAKSDSFDVRATVAKYAEWLRVPLRYEEIGTDGEIAFQEDYGDKEFVDEYQDKDTCLKYEVDNAFVAYSAENAQNRTLLLSMPIDKNCSTSSSGYSAPLSIDIRLLDESGKVIESSNGNEGLMPVVRSEYEGMLKEARDPYITEDQLHNDDIIAQEVASGPNAGKYVVKSDVFESGRPLPSSNEYITKEELSSDDSPSDARVIFGPHTDKIVIAEEDWESLDEGRAANYIPEDELEEYDVESGEGDLTLPQPTSDRDRLQSHDTFWKYLDKEFADMFSDHISDLYSMIEQSSEDNPVAVINSLDEEQIVKIGG